MYCLTKGKFFYFNHGAVCNREGRGGLGYMCLLGQACSYKGGEGIEAMSLMGQA